MGQQAVWRDAKVGTTGSQCREDIFELRLGVIGVQVFHKLIAVGEVDATRRNGNGNSIRNDQLEIRGGFYLPCDFIGDIDRVNMNHLPCNGERQAAISRANL